MVVIPTIHTNGSSKKDLLDKLRAAISLIDKAIDGIIPQGRGPGEGGEGFEPAPAASFWRPMADAPTDRPFLAKFRDDLTIVVDGETQCSHLAGRRAVVRRRGDCIALDVPDDWSQYWLALDEFEGWAPLPGSEG
jgi:hypothetical protein